MHFTSLAVMAAGATLAAAEAQPYRLAAMPGLSLMRRDTMGYQPEQTKCGDGNTCAEACGAGFEQCPSEDGLAHCFNAAAKQSCCQNGSGQSCDEGYYCTHDTSEETWCCPNDMDLAECAAAYTITGGLETVTPTPTPTPAAPTTTQEPRVTTKVKQITTTVCDASSSGYTTAWTAHNSTISTGAPTATVIPVPQPPAVVPSGTSGAAATSFSALLIVAAGAVALL